MYFEHFSERAKRAVFFAHAFAKQQAAPAIDPGHLLRGLLREDPELFVILPGDPARLEAIDAALAGRPSETRGAVPEGFLPLSRSAQEIVLSANRIRERLKQMATGTDHLLYALTAAPARTRGWFSSGSRPSEVQQLLASHGITSQALDQLLADGPLTPQTRVMDDLLVLLNAKLSALADVLIRQGIVGRAEFAALLDRHEGPLTANAFVLPLLDVLVKGGRLDPSGRDQILDVGETDQAGSHADG